MASSLLQCFVILLAVLHTAQCQCRDYHATESSTCSMLFQKLQAALVGNELNLYNLIKVFVPPSRPMPILVNVSYEVSFGYISEDLEPCPGLNNDSTLFNTSGTQYLNFGWTSSFFYTRFHPAEINRMQPQLLFFITRSLERRSLGGALDNVDNAFTWDGIGPIITEELSLFVSSLSCVPSYEDIYSVLWDITSLVK